MIRHVAGAARLLGFGGPIRWSDGHHFQRAIFLDAQKRRVSSLVKSVDGFVLAREGGEVIAAGEGIDHVLPVTPPVGPKDIPRPSADGAQTAGFTDADREELTRRVAAARSLGVACAVRFLRYCGGELAVVEDQAGGVVQTVQRDSDGYAACDPQGVVQRRAMGLQEVLMAV